jgi:hypothetical protein
MSEFDRRQAIRDPSSLIHISIHLSGFDLALCADAATGAGAHALIPLLALDVTPSDTRMIAICAVSP